MQRIIGGATDRTTSPQEGEAAIWVQVFGVLMVAWSLAMLAFAAVGFAAGHGVLNGKRGWWVVAVGWLCLAALVGGVLHNPISVFVAGAASADVVVLSLPGAREHLQPQVWP